MGPLVIYDSDGLTAICGAMKRANGQLCRNVPGTRTSHLGQGRCWLHEGGQSSLKHGRYSYLKRPSIRKLAQAHLDDPNPLDILPELALVRALLEDYINRYQRNTAALLAWHDSWLGLPHAGSHAIKRLEDFLDDYDVIVNEKNIELTDEQEERRKEAGEMLGQMRKAREQKPQKVLGIEQAVVLASEVSKIVERIEKVRAGNAVSRADMLRITTEMGRAVDTFLTDFGEYLATIMDDLPSPLPPEYLPGHRTRMVASMTALKQRIRSSWLAIRIS